MTTTSTNAQGEVFTFSITGIQQYVSTRSINPTTTTDVPTSYIPLTTKFIQPSRCTDIPPVPVPSKLYQADDFLIQGGYGTPSCFPSGFPFSASKVVYSPGICPESWSSACEKTDTSGTLTSRIVSCCPRAYECARIIPQAWEGRFGCVLSSPEPSTATSAWDHPPDAHSIFQMPIVIIPFSISASLPITFQSNTTSLVPSLPSPSGLSKGVIAGIVIGAIVGVALVIALVVMALRIRKKRNADVQNASTNDNERDLKASGAPEVWHGDSTPYSAQHYQGPAELPGTEPVFEMRGTEAASEMRGTEPVSEMRGS